MIGNNILKVRLMEKKKIVMFESLWLQKMYLVAFWFQHKFQSKELCVQNENMENN